MTPGDVNVLWAEVFLDELARSGVRELCVAPGSRSTPLVLAAARDERFRIHSVVDERSAGFMALGIGKASGRPAGVITTSGTAGANLYPAVIEASQAEVPLLTLTADRPHRLRDTDANQAMDQVRLFGSYPRAFMDVAPPVLSDGSLRHLRSQACRAVALAEGPPGGPVHLNFPFDKPLEPGQRPWARPPRPEDISPKAWAGREGGLPFVQVPGHDLAPREEAVEELVDLLAASPRGLIVAGPVPDPHAVGPAALALSAATGFPILADPLSGARFAPAHGAQVVGGYDLLLRSPRARRTLAPDLVIRVGQSPTSAALLTFLREHGGVPQVILDQGYRWKDHLATASSYYRGSPAVQLKVLAERSSRCGDPTWRGLWAREEERTTFLAREGMDEDLLEGKVISALVEDLPESTNLLVASSMPIRELDAFGRPSSRSLKVLANRGTSGIDGLVSTAVGIAAVSRGPTVAVLGDLAFLHDMNGLLALKKTAAAVGFVIVNNDGGGIFHTLPVRDFDPPFTELFATPHGLDLEKAASLYSIPFSRVLDLETFRSSLSSFLQKGESFLLEVKVERKAGHESRRKLLETIVNALEEEPLG